MTTGSGSAALLSVASLDEDAWENLLSFIEERLDVRRIELTHDVLTGIVKASRDL